MTSRTLAALLILVLPLTTYAQSRAVRPRIIASEEQIEKPPTPIETPAPKNDLPPQTPADIAKAEAIIKRAIEVLGGANYTGARTQVSRGRFTTYADGNQALPMQFEDYVQFPDKQRTEFRGVSTRLIQVNNNSTGWIFDNLNRTIKDLKTDEVADFKRGLRASVDNLLRGEWRKAGENKAALAYIGRREAGIGRRNETIRLTYADGFAVDFEFGETDGLPAKVSYTRPLKESERPRQTSYDEAVPYDEKTRQAARERARTTTTEEYRFAQYVPTGGVLAPFVVDTFRDGKQSSRVNYEVVEYNRPLPDSLFAKPADVKELLKKK